MAEENKEYQVMVKDLKGGEWEFFGKPTEARHFAETIAQVEVNNFGKTAKVLEMPSEICVYWI